ncbi:MULTISPECIES: GGDEF domain-containing protein [Vibrio]|uniref:Diguanylate cyclase DosC n=1 Tax=Vibrio algicola TaxID=2662262 RepID=A0A5Q0TEH9_9VIBR|nr:MULTISPECIES: GGDEF domain-containing protein [Vibrio]MBD1576813.1 GGDEF domain-containing protein [Vibrio sp. S11_S32]
MAQVHQTLSEQLRIGEHEIERRKYFMGFTEQDSDLLKSSRSWVEPLVPALVNEFYILQTSIPEISLIIGDRETLSNLHNSMSQYVLDLFSGDYQSEYVDKRLRIGKIHHRIGLSPKLYLSGINQLQLLIEDMIDDNAGEYDIDSLALKRAVRKLLYFDNQFVFETYIAALQNEVEIVNTQLEKYAASLEDQVALRTRQLTELSMRDPLTNLYNQRAFYEQLEKDAAIAQRSEGYFSLLFIDINKFKQVNDTHGHKVGDEVLVAVAKAIESTVRKAETAARNGGDEFCILLPNTKVENLTFYCDRLFAEFDKIKPLDITLSVGGAEISPENGFDIENLVHRADRKMYEAKQLAHKSGKSELILDLSSFNKNNSITTV